jgi:hypothetical protein
MKTQELKQQVMNDLNDILEMSISEIEKQWEPKSEGMKTEDYLCYNQDVLPETWEIKHEQLSFSFPGTMAHSIAKMVKSKFPNGKIPKNRDKTKRQHDFNCKGFQGYVMELREFYNGREYVSDDDNMAAKKDVIKKYENSKPCDLIRLCWKFITDPDELEGVHFPWVNPVVKYTAYKQEYRKEAA